MTRPARGGSTRPGRLRLAPSQTPPFRLPRVVVSHGWFQTPPFRWDPESETLERTERVGGTAQTIRIRQAGAGVWVEPEGLRDVERRELGRRVRRMLQLDADLAGFHDAVAAVDPELAAGLRGEQMGRLLAGSSLWEDVAKTICGTNVSWRQAVAMTSRITALDPEGAFPEPERVIAAGEDVLRADARVGYRAPYIVGAARMAAEGEIGRLEAAASTLEAPGLLEGLRAIPGVGPTSARFLAFLAGRFDVGVAIDSATIPAAGERWFGGRRPSRDEIAAVVEPAGEWAALTLYWATLRRWQRTLVSDSHELPRR